LALDPLMAVEPDPASERGIGAELDERGTEVPIEDVEVVMVDTNTGAGEVIVGDTGRASLGPIGAKGSGLFLGDADEHHAFSLSGPFEVGSGHIFLSLALLEVDDRNTLLLGKTLHGSDEVPGNMTKQGWRGNRLSAVFDQEVHHLAGKLENGDIGIEVHAVDAFALESDVVIEYSIDVRHRYPPVVS